MKNNKIELLFKLAKPYLEINDFGAAHTQRVFDIAGKYFDIPVELEDLVFTSIILHDAGGSSIKDQYEKGPEIASSLLHRLDYDEKIIQEVCGIIQTHHNHPENPSYAFKILYDSDRLVMLTQEEFIYYNSKPDFNWRKIINSIYSEHIKQIAKDLLQQRRQE